ncbi:MAG: hypothetical protein HC880_16305, partial [Bacteroidia bacterium]|nr:hypothetical protein [Bacteroidia bacterium]
NLSLPYDPSGKPSANNREHCSTPGAGIYEDSRRNLWIGTYGGGLSKLDRQTGIFTHYLHQPDNPQSISSNIVYAILEDSRGNLWVGTRGGGLNRFDYQTERFHRYLYSEQNPQSLSNDKVMCIFEDSKKRLWVGTYGGALNEFNPQTGTFRRISEKDGLPNDVAYGILEDSYGHLWISTNKGICQFDPNAPFNSLSRKPSGEFQSLDSLFRNFTVFDGLQSNEFNGGAYFKSQEGQIFFGGINGFTSFYPEKIKFNQKEPPVFLTDFQIFNQSVPIGSAPEGSFFLQRHISEMDKIYLDYTQSVFSIEFAALNFTRSEKNQYAYRLKGFQNSEWNYITDRRLITYTNLNPGTYVFEVKAANNDGVWNTKGATLTIVIKPPFWMTWWFRILGALIGLAIAYTLYRYRINQIQRRKQELEDEVQRQTAQINQQKKNFRPFWTT